jgi:transcriptional regulator with XRE-family HTH domain
MRGLTQAALGRRLGLSFQQIQKYESGRSRVAASLLWRIADALAVDLTFFFSGLSENLANSPGEALTKRHAEVLRALDRMSLKARSAFANLAVAVAEEGKDD